MPQTAWEDDSHAPNKPITFQVQSTNNERKEKGTSDEHGEEASNSFCGSAIQCSQETSFSGLKYIGHGQSTTLRRIFWLVIVVGAGYGLVYQILRSTQKFIDHEINTKLKYEMPDSMDFPSVTLCNTNMFRKQPLLSLYAGYGHWYDAHNISYQHINWLFPQFGLTTEKSKEQFVIDQYPEGLSLHEFVTTCAHSLDSMLLKCKFGRESCSVDDFTTTVTNFGVCFTFNSATNKKSLSVNTAGQRQGLSLILSVEENSAVSAPRENLGFKMHIHPQGEIPNLQDYGIELHPGTHNPIRLDVTEMSILPSPYGKCGRKELNYFDGDYTDSKCFIECETDYVVSRCGCRNFYMPGNATYCSPTQLVRCFYVANEIFAASKNRLCTCPKACKETIYKPITSQSAFPSGGVGLKLVREGDFQTTASAFGDILSGSSSAHLNEYWTSSIYRDVYVSVSGLTTKEGTTLSEMFPNTITSLAQELFSDVFFSLTYDLTNNLAGEIFYAVHLGKGVVDFNDIVMSISYAGERYFQEYTKHSKAWLKTGAYRNYMVEAFQQSGEYLLYNGTESFEDFIDNVYDDFDFEETYEQIYPVVYNWTKEKLVARGHDIYATVNLAQITTDYMSRNLLHADIFFGDLKLEKISEQPSYEGFQFVCDLGGALGLFFGASLLSFIETVDFWFSKGFFSKDKKRNKQVDNIA